MSNLFPEILEDQSAMIAPRLDVLEHCGRNAAPAQVLRTPQNETLGDLVVAAGAPGLLVIGLERRRGPPMQHLAHIGFIDAHAECARGDDDADLPGEKGLQYSPADSGGQPGMVRSGSNAGAEECPSDELREPSRGRVDERSARSVLDTLPYDGEALAIVADPARRKHQIWPVERRDDDVRISHPENTKDVRTSGWCRAAGERDRRWRPKTGAVDADVPIVGAEFVAPLGDAMRLVDCEQRDRGSSLAESARQRGKAFRSAVQQCEPSARGGFEDHAPLIGVELAVHVCRRYTPPSQRTNLVLHERDQRRDDDREPVAHQRGHLITERLPCPRRQHGEHVSPRKQGAEDSELMDAEARVSESLGEDASRAVEMSGERRHVSRITVLAAGTPTPNARGWSRLRADRKSVV